MTRAETAAPRAEPAADRAHGVGVVLHRRRVTVDLDEKERLQSLGEPEVPERLDRFDRHRV